MTETESELHSRLEERDAEIKGLKDEVARLKALVKAQRIALSNYAETVEDQHAENARVVTASGRAVEAAMQMKRESDEARATIARVEAVAADWERISMIGHGTDLGTAWGNAARRIRAALATQPTEARP